MITRIWGRTPGGCQNSVPPNFTPPSHVEKYLKVSDFLRYQLVRISKTEKNHASQILERKKKQIALNNLIIALQTKLDFEDIIKLLIKFKHEGVIYKLIDHPKLELLIKK